MTKKLKFKQYKLYKSFMGDGEANDKNRVLYLTSISIVLFLALL